MLLLLFMFDSNILNLRRSDALSLFIVYYLHLFILNNIIEALLLRRYCLLSIIINILNRRRSDAWPMQAPTPARLGARLSAKPPYMYMYVYIYIYMYIYIYIYIHRERGVITYVIIPIHI